MTVSTAERPGAARVVVLMAMMGLLGAGMVVQLVRVQFGPYAPVFDARDRAGLGLEERLIPERGLIYDRDGVLLATNGTMYFLEVELRQLTDESRKQIASVLSKVLVLPIEDLYAQLTFDWPSKGQYRIRLTRLDPDAGRLPIVVDPTVAGVLGGFLADPQAPDLSGLQLVPTPRRHYPNGTLAGHLLGFVNQEGKGYFGVEGYYDEWLSGKAITVRRSFIPPDAQRDADPPAGVNLVLTIDADIQQTAEIALEEAVHDSKAEGGQVLVMDPQTGEILAMAAWPALDPNNYEPWLKKAEEDESAITPAVAAQYEPGSTFKVLTMAAALDAGVVQPNDIFIDTGSIEVGGHTIRNWDYSAWGAQTMIGCLRYSLNVCLAYVASDKLKAAPFYNYLTEFGVGQLTGIDLAGEVAGQLRTPRHPEWTESDLGTNSFGQGVSVTPIQLLTAVAAVANGGVMVQPHVVREVVSAEGAFYPRTTVLGQPISAAAAQTLTSMLVESLQGETRRATVTGYVLAGKTGTAQIPTDKGYDPKWTIASFIGWGPVNDPRFVVLVRLDKPETSPWGSVVAAPVFQEIVERLVVLLQIPPADVQALAAGG
ncbi:MAG TPA: penicillin-binding protein 2 [Anaerolineales bacterium]|nr:penicillin-binding protein 2 [Anaerolineales bacterium]